MPSRSRIRKRYGVYPVTQVGTTARSIRPSDVPSRSSARFDGAHVQHKEDVDDPERRGDRDEEIAGEDFAGVVTHERAPRLRPRPMSGGEWSGHVAPDGPRRHGDAQFQ